MSILRQGYRWCDNKFISLDICLFLCKELYKCKEVKYHVMANRRDIMRFLDELEVEYEPRAPTVELAKLLIKAARKVGHADDMSEELRRALINDYYFKILDEKGRELNEFLEVK